MGVNSDIPGNTVNVVKVDGNTKAPLPGATFKLTSDTDTTGTTLTTDGEDGTVKFTGLKAGTYYVEETVAPSGYNINSKKFTITISTSGVVTGDGVNNSKLTVNDYPLTVPQTGGAGTIMFTIGGVALITCAGVLFFILMRKKATK